MSHAWNWKQAYFGYYFGEVKMLVHAWNWKPSYFYTILITDSMKYLSRAKFNTILDQ